MIHGNPLQQERRTKDEKIRQISTLVCDYPRYPHFNRRPVVLYSPILCIKKTCNVKVKWVITHTHQFYIAIPPRLTTIHFTSFVQCGTIP
jgi:hypothetical protein